MKAYFDNAATSPLRPEVVKDMHEVLSQNYGNPSSTHGFGRTAKTQIETARKNIAAHFNALPQEIIFTSGGTESNNMLLRNAFQNLGVKTIITTKIEHHAVLHTVTHLEEKGCKIIYLPVDKKGNISASDLEEALSNSASKTLVTLMHINNEIGTILNLEEVAHLCKKYESYFHTDAVQGVGHYAIDLSAIPIDFMSASAHKFHGPKGIGFAFVRKNVKLGAFIIGGGQERGRRAGTEAVHNIVGMEKALTLSYAHLEQEKKKILDLKKYAIAGFKKIYPGVRFNGCCSEEHHSTYTLLNVNLPVSAEKKLLLDFHLDLKGIACSKGSACQSGSNTGSHVLNEILSPKELENPSLRFSFSIFNTQEEVDYMLSELKTFSKS